MSHGVQARDGGAQIGLLGLPARAIVLGPTAIPVDRLARQLELPDLLTPPLLAVARTRPKLVQFARQRLRAAANPLELTALGIHEGSGHGSLRERLLETSWRLVVVEGQLFGPRTLRLERVGEPLHLGLEFSYLLGRLP